MKKILLLLSVILIGCTKNIADSSMDSMDDNPDIHNYKAPLYWSVYEYCWLLEQNGTPSEKMDITEDEWEKITDWVARDLKPYGYNMICTDGFIPMLAKDESGYMTHYGSMSLEKLSEMCKSKGLSLGIYDNPLWIHGPDDTLVHGTDNITFGSLKYKEGDKVLNPNIQDKWFSWVVASHEGAREYIDGFFEHFSKIGVSYIRMDFLSWYENGNDRGMGKVGRGYGRDTYEQALKYICESAMKYNIFTSLVMPHLNNKAEFESRYGNMVRIVADTGNGGWGHFSDNEKGHSYGTWPNCMNMFDGFTFWSGISGRNKVILDGDFIRLNTFANDAEKESVISLQLMAGGPVTIADQYHNIGENLKFYQNEEILFLNKDRFVGKPMSSNLLDKNNQIWYGQLSNGDWVVGLFNRNDKPATMSLRLEDLGIKTPMNARDLWKHEDEGIIETIECNIPGHGCKILRLSNY